MMEHMSAPTTLDLLWGTAQRPRRGPKPSLTLERIVAEAIEHADAEGLASLSMQRLAERLGCAKMALYRYVPGKAELEALGPVVLLPDESDRWRTERLRMVLIHELAHVQRWDCLVQLLAHLARALFWFHPLAWLAVSRLRVEQELACDDVVLASGASAPDYAEHLVVVTAGLAENLWIAPVALGMGRDPSALVFARIDGDPIQPDSVTKMFARIAERAKIRPITFHGLRHTHATDLLRAGVHPKIASERLGHASIAITMDTYSHAIPGLQEDAAQRIDAALRNALPGA